jgi:hypothetical protein
VDSRTSCPSRSDKLEHMFPRTCGFEGCTNVHRARGLCSSHLDQLARGKELTPLLGRHGQKHERCTFPGCTRKHHAGGLCQGHATQRRRGRPLRPLGSEGRGGLPPRRARVGVEPGAAAAVRSRGLPDRPVRPAGLRPQHPACRRPRHRPVGQHDQPPDRGHGAAARAPRRAAVAAVGRVLGGHPGPRLRAAAPGAGQRPGPGVGDDDPAGRRALAVPRGGALLPPAVGAVPQRGARGRA